MRRTMLLALALLTATVVAQGSDAKTNWQKHCAMCHGKDGQGNTPAGRKLGAPNLEEPKAQAAFTDEQAVKSIKEGIKKDGREKMKAYGNEFTDKDIHELVKYVRAFKKGK